jgi:hypothetical protein
MARRLLPTLLVVLAACASAPPKGAAAPLTFSGKALEAPVGGTMVDHVAKVITVEPFSGAGGATGTRVTFTYLGLLDADPAGRTIRVRYEERKIVNGVESQTVDRRAELRLDLSLGKVLEYKNWLIGVVEATPAAIRYVPAKGPD